MATTRDPITTAPGYVDDYAPVVSKVGNTSVDIWMAQEVSLFGHYVKRQTIALWILGSIALVPIFFASHADITLNGAQLNTGEADTLGTGAEMLLILTLSITPLMVLTRARWFFPLRRWYGIMMALTAFTDFVNASITTGFSGGVFGRIAGHTFLIVGLIMNMLLIPLILTANHRAQRWLGRYWRVLHRLVYVVWALLLVHLTLLEGFGFQNGLNGSGGGVDGIPYFHQRLYQLLACSLGLFVLRLPPVKRWVNQMQEEGRGKLVWLAFAPMIALFLLFFAFILHEEFMKGFDLFTLHASTE
jgi:methionine sulfoxide reductase heme-binding subunit